MHVKVLAKKSTFELDISRTKGRIAKILSPIDSTHQITYRKNHLTAYRLKLVFDQFDLTPLNLAISCTEGHGPEILSPLNSPHQITYNYILRLHPSPSDICEKNTWVGIGVISLSDLSDQRKASMSTYCKRHN